MYRILLCWLTLIVSSGAGAQSGPSGSPREHKYAVVAVPFNSAVMDFSPYPYKNGIVFVSSRGEKEGLQGREEDFLSLFYAEESEDGSFSPPELLNKENVTPYHEGPAVFYNNGMSKIITRNSFIKKSKLKDESSSPLELAQSSLSPSGKWTEPVTISFASPEYSIGHPAISSDGSILYFASNMPGSVGGSDLFVSEYTNGAWSSPRNLGATINTPGQELFPYLYNDSILYFASTGRNGLGGLDLYAFNVNSPNRTIIHLPAPVNSPGDDFGIFLEPKGTSGFFSSNRSGGEGADDIYYFEEIQPFIRIQVYDSITHQYVGGAELRLSSNRLAVGSNITDLSGSAEFRLSVLRQYKLSISHPLYYRTSVDLQPALWPAGQQAEVKIYLRPFRQRILSKNVSGLQTSERTSLTHTVTFSSAPLDVDFASETVEEVPDTATQVASDSISLPLLKVIAVENINDLPFVILIRGDTLHDLQKVTPLQLGHGSLDFTINIPRGAKRTDYEKIISDQLYSQGYAISRFLLIRSFFFDSEKVLVRNDASAQLDKIIEAMVTYPQLAVQLIFHSDARGTEKFNLELSKRRAQEVTAYLLRAGIDRKRIVSDFVGEGELLNDCGDFSDCDELLHQVNRTVEFRLIVNDTR